jgi:hypothetical protein
VKKVSVQEVWANPSHPITATRPRLDRPPNEAVHADHHWILDLWFSFVHAQLVLEPLDRVTTVTISKTRISTWLLIAVARKQIDGTDSPGRRGDRVLITTAPILSDGT